MSNETHDIEQALTTPILHPRCRAGLVDYKTMTASGLPTPAQTRAALYASTRTRPDDHLTSSSRESRRKPWLVVTVTCALALVALAFPLPFERTVGYKVRVKISESAKEGQLEAVAVALKETLGDTPFVLEGSGVADISEAYEFHFELKNASAVQRVNKQIAAVLGGESFGVNVVVDAIIEQGSRSAYAQIGSYMDDDSPRQIEAVLRAEYAQVGVSATVDVGKSGIAVVVPDSPDAMDALSRSRPSRNTVQMSVEDEAAMLARFAEFSGKPTSDTTPRIELLEIDVKNDRQVAVENAEVFLFPGRLDIKTGPELQQALVPAGTRAGGRASATSASRDASFGKVAVGQHTLCAVPIYGDMSDLKFVDGLQHQVATMQVYCTWIVVPSNPMQQHQTIVVSSEETLR